MRIIETSVYNFAELSDEVKEKAIESCRLFNVEDIGWYDFIFEERAEQLQNIGFIEPKIYFSGFWSQGDGACFDCKYIDIERAFAVYLTSHKIKHTEALKSYLSDYCSAAIITVNYHYNHERTRRVAYSMHIDQYPHIEAACKKFFEWLEDTRLELCREIYRELEKQYDYLTSDAAIIETIEANEYEFTSDGEMM